MTTRHAKRMKRDAFPLLLREFGESITYFASGVGNGRVIQAIVERDVQIVSETGEQVVQALIIRVLDSATNGISALLINDGTDEVSISVKTNGTKTRRQITRRMNDANGVVRFLVR